MTDTATKLLFLFQYYFLSSYLYCMLENIFIILKHFSVNIFFNVATSYIHFFTFLNNVWFFFIYILGIKFMLHILTLYFIFFPYNASSFIINVILTPYYYIIEMSGVGNIKKVYIGKAERRCTVSKSCNNFILFNNKRISDLKLIVRIRLQLSED